jgi:hypothetical protein
MSTSAPDYPQGRLFASGRRARGRCRRAADETTKALRTMGRLEAVDQAVVVGLRAAADNVDAAERLRERDEATPFMVANAVRTYLGAVAALYARVGLLEPTDDDELYQLLSAPPESA